MPRIPPLVQALGLGGLVPFVLFAMLLWLPLSPVQHAVARSLLFSYAALILSFVGALHWGLALGRAGSGAGGPGAAADAGGAAGAADSRASAAGAACPDALAMLWGVVPCLLGWVALMLPPLFTALVLVAGFVAQFAMDRTRLAVLGAPAWLLRLRSALTAVVVLCLLGAAAAR